MLKLIEYNNLAIIKQTKTKNDIQSFKLIFDKIKIPGQTLTVH